MMPEMRTLWKAAHIFSALFGVGICLAWPVCDDSSAMDRPKRLRAQLVSSTFWAEPAPPFTSNHRPSHQPEPSAMSETTSASSSEWTPSSWRTKEVAQVSARCLSSSSLSSRSSLTSAPLPRRLPLPLARMSSTLTKLTSRSQYALSLPSEPSSC